MILSAPTPADWVNNHLGQFFSSFAAEKHDKPHRVITVESLVRDDGAELRELHGMLCASGTPAPAAARYLADGLGGLLGTTLAYALAGSDAGFLAHRDVRWMLHPDNWTHAVLLGNTNVVVVEGHPWAGQAGVEVVASVAERDARTVQALADTVSPVMDALLSIARGGKQGLWSEVVDGFASALVYQTTIPITVESIRSVQGLIGVPDAQWAKRPAVWLRSTPHGDVCVMHKSGCCLAFTDPHAEDDERDDPDHIEFHSAFAPQPNRPDYCANCSFRTVADCEARQVWWRIKEREQVLGDQGST